MDGLKKFSVLVVDDSVPNLVALTHILNDYTIYAAKDGTEAIKVARERQPDVILLDIIMPGMSGYDVIIELKKAEQTKNIPVMFLTGLSEHDDEEKGLALGAADYITKPFSAAIVRLRVRNQLRLLEQMRTIERMSATDQLTGLPNRRSLEERMMSEWNRAVREKTQISLLVIDVDRFKRYNDLYGHRQGDDAIKAVSRLFRLTLRRPADFAARWDGEEFFALMPSTGADGAGEVAEQIRRLAEGLEVPGAPPAEKITVSIGVNTAAPTRGDLLRAFIMGADSAMHAAKELGRNRVVHFKSVRINESV